MLGSSRAGEKLSEGVWDVWADKGRTPVETSRKSSATSISTFAIVGVVVLANSVAWGIPLLTGDARLGGAGMAGGPSASAQDRPGADQQADGAHLDRSSSSLATGSVPLPERSAAFAVGRGVPLPARAPALGGEADLRAGAAASDLVPRPVKTLYPRPEPAPPSLLAPPSAPARGPVEISQAMPSDVSADNPSDAAATFRTGGLPDRLADRPTAETATIAPAAVARPKREESSGVAFVSPYAPGVRIKKPHRDHPLAGTAAAATPEPYRLSTDTTLDRARRIARRATERFEEMRALLEARERASQTELAGAIVPPGVSRPVASLLGSTRAARSAGADLDPRLVDRPVRDATEIATASAAAPASVSRPAPASIPPTKSMPDTPPVRTARLSAAAAVDPTTLTRSSAERSVMPDVARPPIPVAHFDYEAAANRVDRPAATSKAHDVRPAEPRRPRTVPHRRMTTDRQQVERRRPRRSAQHRRSRKIDGFRPSFHRQLVSANFFGGQR
jgi:hypothetical protein